MHGDWEAQQWSSRDRVEHAGEPLCRYLAELEEQTRALSETVSQLQRRIVAIEGEVDTMRTALPERRLEPDEHQSDVELHRVRQAMPSIGPHAAHR
jgi:chromosome segregation ATPase